VTRAAPGRSIHATLLWGAVPLLGLVLSVVAVLAYLAGEHEAEEVFDARLATSARVLDALLAREVVPAGAAPLVISLPWPLDEIHEDTPTRLGHFYETKIAFQVLGGGSRVLMRSASAPALPFAPLAPGFSDQVIDGGTWRVFVLQSGERWIEVAERLDIRAELCTMLALTSVTPLLFGIPALLLLLSLLIRYGLAPLSELAHRIERREPASLEPVTLSRTPAEIAPVVRALNGLFGRVHDALARERRFTAAAAHELRTPLAALKLHAENAARAAAEGDRQASLARMGAALRRTLRLVEQMLAFSRASAAPEAVPASNVSLRTIVLGVLDEISARMARRGNRLELSFAPEKDDFMVRGDHDKLASLVANLVENAIRYGPERSRIAIELTSNEDGAVTLAVVDEGPGIDPRYRERVFESYFRINETPDEGTGLGLAIVSEIAQQHGAMVTVADGDGGKGTRMIVRFPRPADVLRKRSEVPATA
jgi:two-component system sensor histidine kinase QseC